MQPQKPETTAPKFDGETLNDQAKATPSRTELAGAEKPAASGARSDAAYRADQAAQRRAPTRFDGSRFRRIEQPAGERADK